MQSWNHFACGSEDWIYIYIYSPLQQHSCSWQFLGRKFIHIPKCTYLIISDHIWTSDSQIYTTRISEYLPGGSQEAWSSCSAWSRVSADLRTTLGWPNGWATFWLHMENGCVANSVHPAPNFDHWWFDLKLIPSFVACPSSHFWVTHTNTYIQSMCWHQCMYCTCLPL